MSLHHTMGPIEPLDNLGFEVDPNFLHKGDEVRIHWTTVDGRHRVEYATADMDGYAVSKRYGWLHGETIHECDLRKERNLGKGSSYINVKWRGEGKEVPNRSVYFVRDSATFYSTKAVQDAEEEALRAHTRWRSETQRLADIALLREEADTLRTKLTAVEVRLDGLLNAQLGF